MMKHAQPTARTPASRTALAARANDTPLSRHLSIQREASGPAHHNPDVFVRSALQVPGRPLDADTRRFMEPRFGHDFSSVRLHTDDAAARSAQALRANAYTVGRDILFDAGRFALGTEGGRRLMAHELAHVVQQSEGPVSGAKIGPGLTISDPQDAYERRAAQIGESVAAGRTAGGALSDVRAALPASATAPDVDAVQRDAATTWGAIGAIAGIAALAVAAFAWLKPKNVNATAQGIQMQPNPFQFSTLGDNAAQVPNSPEAQKKFQSAAEQPPQNDKVLELRTDDDNDATFNLQYNTDGHNIISAGVVPGDTKGYQGGYNGSIASVILSETQTFPPAKGAVQPAAQPSAAGAGGPAPAPETAAPPATREAPAAGGSGAGAAAQVARAVVHFSGTNGKSGEPLQTFGGEVLVTGDGTVNCIRSQPLNGIGYGLSMGSYRPYRLPHAVPFRWRRRWPQHPVPERGSVRTQQSAGRSEEGASDQQADRGRRRMSGFPGSPAS